MASTAFLGSRLRAAGRRQAALAVGGCLAVAGFLVLFFSVYGDPAGPTPPGELDVTVSWNTDGTLTATMQTPFRSLEGNERVAAVMVPAILGGSEVRTRYPEDKGGTRSIEARTVDAVAPPRAGLDLSTAELSQAAERIGLDDVDLALSVPHAGAVVRGPEPSLQFGSTSSWDDVRSTRPFEVSVALHPTTTGWVAQMGILALGATVTLALGVSTGRRALRGALPERRARRRYGIGLGVSAVALVWALRLERLSDRPTVAWELAGSVRFLARWGSPLVWLCIAVYLIAALNASWARDQVRRRYPPPPGEAAVS